MAPLVKMINELNRQINKYGFFTNGYELPREINQVTWISRMQPDLGNAVVIGESSYDEHYDHWKDSPYAQFIRPKPQIFYYRLMKD